MPQENRLAFFPVSIFGAVMGLSGLTIAIQNLHQFTMISAEFGSILAVFTAIIFTLITTTYLLKIIKFPTEVIKEIEHPIALNFFPAFSISLLLLGLIFKDWAFLPAQIIWSIGAILHFGFLLYVLNSWLHHEKWQINLMTPAWFIPVVGNIVVPIGAVHFANLEIGWFFFSIGLVFWLILNSIVIYRLFFHPPMVKLLEPTLFMLIAPPAVGFISYVSLQGEIDDFARILYYIALFLTMLLLSQTSRFIKVPFALSWWAYTFPLAAITIASSIMHQQLGLDLFLYIALFLLAILSLLIAHLLYKTIMAIKNKKLCQPLH